MRFAAIILGLGLLVSPALGAGPIVLDVWPEGKVPGEPSGIGAETIEPGRPGELPVQRVGNVTRPTLSIYLPPKDKANGAAVVIAPGGGYNILAFDKEGTEVAEWLNTLGVAGIVLKYRVPRREGTPRDQPPDEAIQDAQRAMSLVRGRASEWGIDPARIGILGFSAGGNLAARAVTQYGRRAYEAIDATDEVPCRPDFGVLVYPAYLEVDGKLRPEYPVTSETPPCFFAHAGDDRVSPLNSVAMYAALKGAGVPAELHIYAGGGHGFGLRPSDEPCSTWPARCAEWMRSRKVF